MPETTPDTDFQLHWFWRIALALLAVAFLAAAAYSWYWPPETTTFAPQATTITDATEEVADRSETAVVLLIALAVVAAILAANGRKLSSAKIGGQELTWRERQVVARVTEERTTKVASEAGLDASKTQEAIDRAISDAFSRVRAGAILDLDVEAIAQAAVAEVRPPGLTRR